MTFASAAIANEWWSLVQSEYPDAGVRTSPQLFSFNGDKFPYKTANDKKFDHLKTKWFYSQIGDSDGTGGRPQDVIPVQNGKGELLGIEGAAADAAGGPAPSGAGNEQLERIRELVEANASQIKSLTETQSNDRGRMERMEKMIEENAIQVKALSESQAASQEQMKEIVEQNAAQIKALSEGQSANHEQTKNFIKQNIDQLASLAKGQATTTEHLKQALEQSAKASSDMVKELKKQRQHHQSQTANGTVAESRVDCAHNVHPPPRKIEKTVIGYDYAKNS